MKKLMLIIIIAGVFTSCKVFQYEETKDFSLSNKNNVKSGRCYSKCLMPDKYEFHSEQYAVFTGNEFEEQVAIEIMQIELKPKTTKSVKKEVDGDLEWSLIEVPAITKEIKVLIDTTQSQNYKLQRISYEEINDKSRSTEWIEILCKEDITRLILGQIQNSLREKGYYKDENTFELDVSTKSSLSKFQYDNNLPIGQLDFDTLYLLGITSN